MSSTESEIESNVSVGIRCNYYEECLKPAPAKKVKETAVNQSCPAADAKNESYANTKAVISYRAPNFEGIAVINEEFDTIELANFFGRNLVLLFYPLDFAYLCPTELIAFSDSMPKFRHLDTEVIACSVNSHYSHLAWIQTPRKKGGLGKINFPLLSDSTHKISKDYGIFVEGPAYSRRAQFIIDHRGLLRYITINDAQVGRSVIDTIRIIKELMR